MQHTYSCLFGTFLCNNAKERGEKHTQERTCSVWSLLRAANKAFKNLLYSSQSESVCTLCPQRAGRHPLGARSGLRSVTLHTVPQCSGLVVLRKAAWRQAFPEERAPLSSAGFAPCSLTLRAVHYVCWCLRSVTCNFRHFCAGNPVTKHFALFFETETISVFVKQVFLENCVRGGT